MNKVLATVLLIPLVISAAFFTGCEDDDSLSGTATVTGNVRQFYSPNAIAFDSTEKAAANVTVELRITDGSYSEIVSSAADGTFRFENVPAGDFELVLTGGGLTGALTFTVPAGSTVALVDIIVKSDGTTLEGEIVKSEPAVEATPAPAPAPAPAPKVQWIDQQQLTGPSGASVNRSSTLAQTFTVGTTNGSILKVEFLLLKMGTPPDVTVTITPTVGGWPSAGTVLPGGTATIAASDVGGALGWVTATFATPPSVQVGTQYAIVVSSAGGAGDYYSMASVNLSADPYAGGEAYVNAGGGWTSIGRRGFNDHAFKVWLEK